MNADMKLYGQQDAVNQTPKKVSVPLWLIRNAVWTARVVGPYAPLWGPHLFAVIIGTPLALVVTVPAMVGLWFYNRPVRIFSDRFIVAPSWLPRFGGRPVRIPGAIPTLRTLELGCYRAARVQLFRWQWPRVCARSGVVGIVDRMPRYPKLTSVKAGWVGRRLQFLDMTIRPLPIQRPDFWERIAHQLVATIDGADSEITADPNSVARFDLHVAMASLPPMIELGTDTPVSVLDDGRELPGDYVLGVDIRGDLIIWRPDEPGRSMAIFAGAQGSGKSSLAELVALQAGRRGDRIIGINPKGDAQYGWAAAFASVANTPAGRFMAIMWAVWEVDRRASVLESLGYNSYLQLTDEERLEHDYHGRLLILVEEVANFVKSAPASAKKTMRIPMPDGEIIEQPEKEWWMASMAGLGHIASMGRSLGVGALFLPQHPIADNLGPDKFGSTLNANCNTQVGIGKLSAAGLTSLFGKGLVTARQELIHQSLLHGRCTFAGLSNKQGAGTRDGQLFFMPRDLLIAEAADLEADTVAFDQMCRTANGPDLQVVA